MSRILDSIVELQNTQGKLETLMQEKQYLQAVRVLRTAERNLYSKELGDVGALSNLREKVAKTKMVYLF